ncbi:MAG: penicillin-binding protein 1A, partial [Erysipelotrichaceae bacterium]
MTKKHKTKKFFKLSTLFSSIVLLFMIMTLVVAGTGFAYISSVIAKAPVLDPIDFESPDSTKIYDKNGILISDIGLEKRDNVSYDDLPQSIIDAFLSIEDSRFFEHNGFDVPRFLKVTLETLKNLDFGAGGSTLTQQLVKNTYYGSEEQIEGEKNWKVKLDRKISEIYLALEAEKVLSKERILELYLNKINFGVPANKRGIQTASQYYFGKDVYDLSLIESALLAGVINKPYLYNPVRDLQSSIDRTHNVLDLMVYHGYITPAERDLAYTINIEDLIVGSLASTNTIPYQSYVDVVIQEVIDLTGQNPVDVPMVIYTNMDRELQNQVEAIQNGSAFEWINDRLQTGMITIDQKTGAIMAIGGGRNYNGERLFNRATDMFRQPGSTMKSILSYLLAFEYLGWSTKHVLSDEPYSYSTINPKMIVGNVNGKYQGDVLLEYAFGFSLNIPAILTLKQVVNVVGSATVVEHLNSIGFTNVTLGTGNMTFDLGYAIGGSTLRVSPYQLAAAYTVLYNSGQYVRPHTVNRIEFSDGSMPLEPTYAKTKIVSEESAYLVTRLLRNNVDGNYFNSYKLMRRPYPTFIKTGTSNWGEEGLQFGIPDGSSKDLWAAGGTNEYVSVVWVGFDNAIKGQLSHIDSAIAKKNYREKILGLLTDKIYENRDAPGDVEKPAEVVNITHVLGVYPYVSYLPDMNPSLVVSGLIKKQFAEIPQLKVPAVYNPSSINLGLQNKGGMKHLTITLNDYPDLAALSMAAHTRDMTLTVKDVTINATGVKLFDYSWVYGPVKYNARIIVDGVTVDTIQSSSPIIETDLSITPSNAVVVCG